jgi:O-antigen/teichoic acid export membrane protein
LSINVIFGHICTFLIKLYLNGNGATSQILGFYEVSTVILITYVGMIFTSMSMDFYPRLTSINQDNSGMKELVNNQLEIGLLLVTPAIIFLYLVAPFVIQLLYTKEFLPVILIFKAALFSIIIKAIIWPLAFIILAKGNKKQYFKQELVGDFLNVSLTILLYNLYGLVGIGIASVVNFSLYGFYVYYIVNKNYDFCFRNDSFKIIIFSIIAGLVCCVSAFFVGEYYSKIFFLLVLLVSIIYSYYQLDNRIGVKKSLQKILNKVLLKLK